MRSQGPRFARRWGYLALGSCLLIGCLAPSAGAVPPPPRLPDHIASRYEGATAKGDRRLTVYRDRRAVAIFRRHRVSRRLSRCEFGRLLRRVRRVLIAPAYHVFAPDRKYRQLQAHVNGDTRTFITWETRDPFGSILGSPSERQWATIRFLDALLGDLLRTGCVTRLGC